jgi:lipopolysaccharide biosynthesis glycosyltransferase
LLTRPLKDLKKFVTQSRLFLEKLLPCVNHLLWIDADAFVLDDLTDLWEMRVKLPPCGVAARNSVLDNVIGNMIKVLPLHGGGKGICESSSKRKKGFNAGVLLRSLDRLRETNFFENIASYWSFKLGGNDQIALNMQCSGTHAILDPTWNVFKDYPDDPVYQRIDEWHIVHMQGLKKPWIETNARITTEFGISCVFHWWKRF